MIAFFRRKSFRRKSRLILSGIVILAALCIVVLKIHEVDNSLKEEDRIYIEKYLTEQDVDPMPNETTYVDQVDYIAAVQDAVLSIAPKHQALPYNRPREPKDVYLLKYGFCFDRSRVIEKILRSAGFKTRHINLYSTATTKSGVKSLLTPQVPSHAVTEVKTKEGWLVVDSNTRWLSLDQTGLPVPVAQIRPDLNVNRWDERYASNMNSIFKEGFVYVYGLYSRHGRFYPPYNFIPDVNWREMLYNIVN